MADKRQLFEKFHERLENAIASKHYFEASWYVYALLEDRMVSMLQNSGGVPQPSNGRRFLMLGNKVNALQQRAISNQLLNTCFDPAPIWEWINSRNDLMHGMANGTLSLQEIDKHKYLLATKGQDLIRQVSSGAMRLKKHR